MYFVGITTINLKGGFTLDVLIWALVFVFFVIAEIATVQLISIWFAVGALVALIFTYFFEMSLIAQLGIFILASGTFLAITFPYLKKRRSIGHIHTNSELDVGKTARVIEEIDADKNIGRVTLNGVDWSAVPAEREDIIPVGSIVTVVKVQGAKLIVSLKEEPQSD